jgi:hypothetical protein
MMNLPNAHLAVVEEEMVCCYLLNPAHPDNGGETEFFVARGFQIEHWGALATALRELVGSSPVAKSMASAHGAKRILDGRIGTPSGKKPWVRTLCEAG